MSDLTFLDWPFFEARHRDLSAALEAWCGENLPVDHADVDAACRRLVVLLGQGGWLRRSGAADGETLDLRTLCLIRETLARRHQALRNDREHARLFPVRLMRKNGGRTRART